MLFCSLLPVAACVWLDIKHKIRKFSAISNNMVFSAFIGGNNCRALHGLAKAPFCKWCNLTSTLLKYLKVNLFSNSKLFQGLHYKYVMPLFTED